MGAESRMKLRGDAADPGAKLSVSSAEDLSHGADRVCVQTECERPDDDVPDDRRGDAPGDR
jgi:hypothetical protein